MLRVIKEVKPEWVVGENVAGILSMDNGGTFEQICLDLEDAGYAVQAYIIPACGIGAWHRRDRVWIVANSNSRRLWGTKQECDNPKNKRKVECNAIKYNKTQTGYNRSDAAYPHNPGSRNRLQPDTIRTQDDKGRPGQLQPESCKDGEDVSNPKPTGLQRQPIGQMEESSRLTEGSKDAPDSNIQGLEGINKKEQRSRQSEKTSGRRGIRQPKPGLGRMVDGLPPELDKYWDTEPDISRTTKEKKDRINRIKVLGNAIVSQVVYEIFKAIDKTY